MIIADLNLIVIMELINISDQTALPPVVFSEEFGNIKNASYEYSIKEWRNVSYMIWKAEGVDTENNIAVGNIEHGATIVLIEKKLLLIQARKHKMKL